MKGARTPVSALIGSVSSPVHVILNTLGHHSLSGSNLYMMHVGHIVRDASWKSGSGMHVCPVFWSEGTCCVSVAS